MQVFNYCRPRNLKQVIAILSQHGPDAALLSGGTNLVVDWRAGKVNAKLWVDIFGFAELRFIEDQGACVCIGSATTMQDLAGSPVVRQFAGFLAEAAGQVGSPQIRNRATIGGNLVSASPAADLLPPLLVLNATLLLRNAKGEKEIPLCSFLTGPKATVRQPDEILVSVRFPKPPSGTLGRFQKIGRRRALAISACSLALLLLNRGNRFEEIRIALGAVAPQAFRAEGVERFLLGKELSGEVIQEAAVLAAGLCHPIDDIRGTISGRKTLMQAWMAEVLSEYLPSPNFATG